MNIEQGTSRWSEAEPRQVLGRATVSMEESEMRQTFIRLLLIAVLPVCASTLAMAQTPPRSPPIPTPGQLVDLGGWRVHLHCMGEASASQPTVILEAGAGGFSVNWSLVQPEVARFARVCSYDRSGLGWSELGPRPRTMRQNVWELHTLLDKRL